MARIKPKKRTLTRQQELFVAEYIVNLNAVDAARKARYKSPENNAFSVLNGAAVSAAIQDKIDQKVKRSEVTADQVIHELKLIGFANMADYMRITPDGDPLVSLADMTRDQAAAVSQIKVEQFSYGKSTQKKNVEKVTFRLHDKQAALVSLGKHLGIFREDVYHHLPDAEERRVAIEDLTEAEAASEWVRLCSEEGI